MLATLLLTLSTVAADPPPARPALIEFSGLEKKTTDLRVRILDARSKADYQKGHVPGAVWVDVKAASAIAGKPGGLKDRDAWTSWLAGLGLPDGGEVFVYDASRQLDAARVFWLLGYLGVDRVGLVDGGFPLWAKEGHPVSIEVPKVPEVAREVHFRPDRLATKDDVLGLVKAPGSTKIVDARSPDEHSGKARMSNKKAGHIPAACPLEWKDLVDADGRFLPEDLLKEKVRKAGIQPGDPVVTHCQGGGRASVDAFVFERLGHPTRNYYLGWSEWGNAGETPVETRP